MSTPDAGDDAGPREEIDAAEASRRTFADEFGSMYSDIGGTTMEGRILGYVMIMQRPYISSAELVTALNASAGSVSTGTRRLVETGFLKRHVVPGDRSHYFRADNDVWGSWLAGERRYLDREREMIEYGLSLIAESADERDAAVRQRLVNGRDYFSWIAAYHHKMLEDWEAFKAARDAESPTR